MSDGDQEHDGELISPAQADYQGSAWRARFLRAPKMAIELATREDFAPLSTFATVRLGLKTGADSFFFLERLPDEEQVGRLLPKKGVTLVRGHDGWQGEIATSDLRPAILNPHQMSDGGDRYFTVPKSTKHLYLFPQHGKLRHDLPDYVRLGELAGLHQKALVSSNADDSGWYRQVRGLVSSEWALPYNSAYDYGAWFNPGGAVLNGRFVGVEALVDGESDILGACLTSTFAAMGRLTEGVATGVEGAFDVGPPAARRIMIPDYRRFGDEAAQAVLSVLNRIRDAGFLLPAPAADGHVPRLRRELDSALLVALGLSAGKAAALQDRLYASYGRWRTNIENVEGQMRGHRRQMQATGQSRNVRPVETAGKRVWEELEHLVPILPKGVLPQDETMEVVHIPAAAAISSTEPLFDQGLIMTKGRRVDLGSYERVRYVAMLRQLGVVGNVDVPVSSTKAGAIADLFERERIRFRELASQNASKYISADSTVAEVIEIATKYWFAACRKSALSKPVPKRGAAKLN